MKEYVPQYSQYPLLLYPVVLQSLCVPEAFLGFHE